MGSEIARNRWDPGESAHPSGIQLDQSARPSKKQCFLKGSQQYRRFSRGVVPELPGFNRNSLQIELVHPADTYCYNKTPFFVAICFSREPREIHLFGRAFAYILARGAPSKIEAGG